MNVKEFAEKTGCKVLAGTRAIGKEITSAYVSDLLSWVMAHGKEGTAWVTVQTHLNVVAVACLHDFACVIIPENIEVPIETLKKAEEEGMPMLSFAVSGYGICKQLSRLQIPEV
jgi:hypothetical protein